MTTDTLIVALEQLREHVRKIVLSGDLRALLHAAYPDEGEPDLRARGVLQWATSTLSVAELQKAIGIDDAERATQNFVPLRKRDAKP